MGRLLFTENGKQMWRTFTFLRVIWPDGRVSKAMKVDGTFLLQTGTEPETERVLELVADEKKSAPKHALLPYAAAFLLGIAFEALS